MGIAGGRGGTDAIVVAELVHPEETADRTLCKLSPEVGTRLFHGADDHAFVTAFARDGGVYF